METRWAGLGSATAAASQRERGRGVKRARARAPDAGRRADPKQDERASERGQAAGACRRRRGDDRPVDDVLRRRRMLTRAAGGSGLDRVACRPSPCCYSARECALNRCAGMRCCWRPCCVAPDRRPGREFHAARVRRDMAALTTAVAAATLCPGEGPRRRPSHERGESARPAGGSGREAGSAGSSAPGGQLAARRFSVVLPPSRPSTSLSSVAASIDVVEVCPPGPSRLSRSHPPVGSRARARVLLRRQP